MMSRILDEHRQYLADERRLDAYARALDEVIRDGDVVVDLAAGTGILGHLALQAGAARVYSVDDGPITAVGRAIARANGTEPRQIFIRELSTRVDLPERVDVVVCDQVAPFGVEAGLFQYLSDAHRRFLKPEGRTVPCGVELHVAPLESDELRARVDFWNRTVRGVSLHPVRDLAENSGYPDEVSPAALLGPGARIASCVLPPPTLASFGGRATCHVRRDGRFDALCGWFVAHLSPSVAMTNDPTAADRIARRQVMLPVGAPVEVRGGERIDVEVRVLPSESLVNWVIEIRRGSKILRTSHSTFKGMLIEPNDLALTSPARRPELTAAGAARRTVLELCDGTHTLVEIEDALRVRHPDVVATRHDAATFVAEVIVPYGRR